MTITAENIWTIEYPDCPHCDEPLDRCICMGHGDEIGRGLLGDDYCGYEAWWDIEPPLDAE